MIRSLDHLDQRAVGGAAADLETGALQLRQQVVVHFVAMAMALDDHVLAVALAHVGAGHQLAVLGAQTHGAAQIGGFGTGFHAAGGVLPLGDQANDRVRAVLIELGGVGIGPAHHIAGVLDDCDLHP